jgi:MoaA/NifB/PqqE/SkfB family radical SAM enzyme/SAM-dependent methyltransferase
MPADLAIQGSRPPRRALIRVGITCNNRCTFCHTRGDGPGRDDNSELVERKIERARELGHSMVVFSGGEPTLRPELRRWARLCQQRHLAFGLVTNGRMLAYPRLVDELCALGLRYAHVSLHGASAEIHDAMVRADAFEQTCAGIKCLSGRDVELTVACVVTRKNLHGLRALVEHLTELGAPRVKFAMPEPKGVALADFDEVVPPASDVAAAVSEAMRFAQQQGSSLEVFHEGIPSCLLPGLQERVVDLRVHGFVTSSNVGEADFHPVDCANQVHPDVCADCGLRGPCRGLYRPYFERRGSDELAPVVAQRSNSFNYAPLRRLAWPPGSPCPLLADGVAPYDLARNLFLRDGSGMTLCETNSRDFSDAELSEVKRELAQIYVDATDGSASQDLARDLRKLQVTEECRACPQSSECANCFAADENDVWAHDDAWLRARLAHLEGDVLEVGCGAGRYLDELAPAAEAGRLRYTGIDPDREALERLSSHWPWARLHAKRAEDYDCVPGSLDHVLLLDSYNHLEQPGPVFSSLVRALRSGGTLLVEDNVVFGLVRTAAQLARAECGPARFEHFRNHGARQAEQLLASQPLRRTERREVGPDTSNQWVLVYRKEASE